MTSVKNSFRSTNRLATEKFIERIKKHPCLYDIEVKKKITLKEIDLIWTKIAEDSDLTICEYFKLKLHVLRYYGIIS